MLRAATLLPALFPAFLALLSGCASAPKHDNSALPDSAVIESVGGSYAKSTFGHELMIRVEEVDGRDTGDAFKYAWTGFPKAVYLRPGPHLLGVRANGNGGTFVAGYLPGVFAAHHRYTLSGTKGGMSFDITLADQTTSPPKTLKTIHVPFTRQPASTPIYIPVVVR
jgi:hypothetical protein